MNRRFSNAKEKYFKYALNKTGPIIEPCRTPWNYVFEVTANVLDKNTLFTVFQICKNIS